LGDINAEVVYIGVAIISNQGNNDALRLSFQNTLSILNYTQKAY